MVSTGVGGGHARPVEFKTDVQFGTAEDKPNFSIVVCIFGGGEAARRNLLQRRPRRRVFDSPVQYVFSSLVVNIGFLITELPLSKQYRYRFPSFQSTARDLQHLVTK